ncbi:YbbR-like domain-containing protein [uncultured Veillonella sp.]|uniref:CdaR family protein n=1 Tax=uncultured Veillonella sp. TaxID=159268 RepID=UPI0026233FDD|nr:CdaR family protein [uncultured Veillonella sp.]
MMRFIQGIQGHWLAKILSLLGAILLWFFIMKEQNPIVDITYTVPVEVQGLNPDYVVTNVPKEVKVHLQGPRNAILAVSQSSLKAHVDMSDVSPGQLNLPIEFVPPSGVNLVEVSPDSVLVTVDEYTVREMPVEVQQVGKVPDDIAIKSIATVPKVVSISGAKEQVTRVAHVMLRVKMGDHRANFTASGNLVAVDGAGKEIDSVTITPRQGQAQITLEQIRFEKNLSVTPNFVGSVPNGYIIKSVTVEPQQVLISGKENSIKSMTDIKTVPISLANQSSTIDGDFDILSSDMYNANPAKVHVTVEIMKKFIGDTTDAKTH